MSIREKKEAFRKAYYESLQKLNMMEKKQDNRTKKDLFDEAEAKGLNPTSKMTKADLIKLLEE